MKWFKHDTRANMDPRLQKVLSSYGLEGYGLYWYCVELCNSGVTEKDIRFALDHDAQGIARNTNNTPHKVEEMMSRFIELDLFMLDENGVICCPEYKEKLDKSMTSNPNMRKIIEMSKKAKTKKIDTKIDTLSEIDTKIDTKIDTFPEIDTKIDTKIDTFPEIDTKIDTFSEIDTQIDTKIDTFSEIDTQIDTQIDTFSEIDTKIDTQIDTNQYDNHDSGIENTEKVNDCSNNEQNGIERYESHDKVMQELELELELELDLKRSCSISENVSNDEFEKFWNIYDKKVNKPKCRNKWAKLKPSEKFLIFQNLPAYVKSTPVKKYRSGPLVYLNNEGWNDEIISNDLEQDSKNDFSWMKG